MTKQYLKRRIDQFIKEEGLETWHINDVENGWRTRVETIMTKFWDWFEQEEYVK